MSKNSKALFHVLLLDYRFSIIVFWAIFLASLLPLFILAATTGGDIIISSSVAIAFFCAINGFLMIKETFSFSIRMGATRQEYVWTGLIFFLVLSAVMSILSLIFVYMSKWINSFTVTDFTLLPVSDFFLESPVWYTQFTIDFLLSFFILITGFLLSTIFHKFGMVGGLSSLALLFILLVLPATRSEIISIFVQINMNEWAVSLNYLGIFGLIVAMSLGIWLLLRNASIFPGVTR